MPTRITPHPSPLPMGEGARSQPLLGRSLSPSAFACECGHAKLQARQGELAERDRVRGNARCMVPLTAEGIR